MDAFFIFLMIIIVLAVLAMNYNSRSNKSNENLKIKTMNLKEQNKIWYEKQEYYFQIVQNGKTFEENKEFSKAITEYENGLEYCYSEPTLKIHNYSNSIHRLVILYGKTKQLDKLKNHLEEAIERHPNFKDSVDWKTRLEKLKKMK